MSENDPNNVDDDSEEEDEEGNKRRIWFNKDDGDQSLLFKPVFQEIKKN